MPELRPEQLRARCDPATLAFASTAELPALDGAIGQDRALEATAFGMAMRRPGYNLFALGPPATGKTRVVRRVLSDRARREPTPSDWCYVHNFAEPYRPTALALPAGRATELRDAIEALVDDCRRDVPRAFEGEEFERRKSAIMERLARRQQEALRALETAADLVGFGIVRTPGGLTVTPVRDGKPLDPDDIAALPDDVRERLTNAARDLQPRVDAALRALRDHEREARAAHGQLVESAATGAIRPLVQEVRDRFAGIDGVLRHLDQLEGDLVDHAEQFGRLADGAPSAPFLPPPGAFLERYRVNVLVDRRGVDGAPVVVEANPTHANLLGRIEHRVHLGTLVTDFTLIKAGALHRANGGYLVLQAKDVLGAFAAWNALKKALITRTVRIEEPLDDLRLVSTVSLAPEPIPLDVKVVLIGSPYLYYLLHAFDEDFRALFKVKVDFDDSLPRTPAHERLLARFVGDVCREDGLRHFAPSGVAGLVEHCARRAGDAGRLSTRLGEIIEVLREASWCAEQAGRDLVAADDVRRAVAAKRRREDLVEERLARLTAEGTLRIATDGTAVGQVNGLAVLGVGDHAFGRPVRITARTFLGEPGVVDIEREAKLGGRVHSKGVLILGGFLAGRFAHDRPLAVSATLGFEQQYDEVDGDSASSAELYALLSSIGGVPLDQGLAVTGSVNQQGEIQAVGGVNEKVEGFFDACRTQGLTGRQGVLVPAANVRHLMLREDVVDAVREGRFRVLAVGTVDEGVAILAGRPAGERDADGRYPEGSVYAAVDRVLASNVERLQRLRRPVTDREP